MADIDLTALSDAELEQEGYRREAAIGAAREAAREVQAEYTRRWAGGVLARHGGEVAAALRALDPEATGATTQLLEGAGGIESAEAVGTPGN